MRELRRAQAWGPVGERTEKAATEEMQSGGGRRRSLGAKLGGGEKE